MEYPVIVFQIENSKYLNFFTLPQEIRTKPGKTITGKCLN